MAENEKTVLLVATYSADRSVALEAMLRDCIAEHGWSVRLRVLLAGIDDGAGEASRSVLQALADAGVADPLPACPELALCTDLSLDADLILADSETAAEAALDLVEADGKPIFALDELIGADVCAAAEDDDIAAYVARLQPLMPLILRPLISAA